MGEVFLAEDLQLERKVALKVLPLEVASNQKRMRRFIQEAKSASALNHPNIITIYEIGESDGTNFIAMEFVEGETLRAKIHREKTDLRTLLKYLAQVAEGLAKAHAAGIIHRDLKPDNIMISRDGFAKILDFGLAKLVEPQTPQQRADDKALSEVATAMLPQALSAPGIVMGTAGYMSPEQAQGKSDIDQRSDIFSFGCILFEAATGRAPFGGDSVVDTLHKIIHAPAPPIRDFNSNAPMELQRIIRRCLQKDHEERYQTIKDVAIELKELRRELQAEFALHYSPPPPQKSSTDSGENATKILSNDSLTGQTAAAKTDEANVLHSTSSAEYIVTEIRQHKIGAAIFIGLLALIVAGAGIWIYKPSAGEQKQASVSFQSAELTRLTTSGKVTDAAISPDGKYVAHVVDDGGRQSLWVRQIATQSNVQIVPPAEVSYIGLAFSPDGNYVYYTAGTGGSLGTLYQVPSLGGTARRLLEDVGGPVSFAPDGKRFAYLSWSPNEGEDMLMIANSDGSGVIKLASRRGDEYFYDSMGTVSWSPDGKTIISPAAFQSQETYMTVVAVSADSGEIKFFTQQRWVAVRQVRWLSDGNSVLITAGKNSQHLQIWQVSYPSGEVRQVTNDLNNYPSISLDANSNTLVTVEAEEQANIWVSTASDTTRATQVTQGKHFDNFPSWTPDGNLVYNSNADGNWNLYLTGARGGNARQLTADSNLNRRPSVSPDGRYIAFFSRKSGVPRIWLLNTDGSKPKQLTENLGIYPQWSPDGQWIVYRSFANNQSTLMKVAVNGGQPVKLSQSKVIIDSPVVSPDGKQIACYYQEEINAPVKLAILPFEGGEPTKIFDLQLTGLPETNLRWTVDGRAIVYGVTRDGVSNLWAQPIDGGAPKQLTNFTNNLIFSFDFSRDGKQLALSRGTKTSDAVLITNFKQ